jgi:hypothetical protein
MNMNAGNLIRLATTAGLTYSGQILATASEGLTITDAAVEREPYDLREYLEDTDLIGRLFIPWSQIESAAIGPTAEAYDDELHPHEFLGPMVARRWAEQRQEAFWDQAGIPLDEDHHEAVDVTLNDDTLIRGQVHQMTPLGVSIRGRVGKRPMTDGTQIQQNYRFVPWTAVRQLEWFTMRYKSE